MDITLNDYQLIVITGLPASGKTTLGRQLSLRDQIEFLSKDDIKKEIVASSIKLTRELDRVNGIKAVDLMMEKALDFLSQGKKVIIESNFKEEWDTAKIYPLAKEYSCLQIVCEAPGEVLWQRFQARLNSETRSHLVQDPEEWKEILLYSKDHGLSLPGQKIFVNSY